MAVADSYDAMTSEHAFRTVMNKETAFTEIDSGKGTQFDPEVTEAFLKIYAKQINMTISKVAPGYIANDTFWASNRRFNRNELNDQNGHHDANIKQLHGLFHTKSRRGN